MYQFRLTRRVPVVEQEVLTYPEHLSSPPMFRGVRVTISLYFCVVFCRSLFVHLSFFVIVLSVLLLFTDAHCPFGVIELFLEKKRSCTRLMFYVKLLYIPWPAQIDDVTVGFGLIKRHNFIYGISICNTISSIFCRFPIRIETIYVIQYFIYDFNMSWCNMFVNFNLRSDALHLGKNETKLSATDGKISDKYIINCFIFFEYLCHNWPLVCSIRRKHFLVFSSFKKQSWTL